MASKTINGESHYREIEEKEKEAKIIELDRKLKQAKLEGILSD